MREEIQELINKRDLLLREIEDINVLIKSKQQSCLHKNKILKWTDNSDCVYRYHYDCPVCGKKWISLYALWQGDKSNIEII